MSINTRDLDVLETDPGQGSWVESSVVTGSRIQVTDMTDITTSTVGVVVPNRGAGASDPFQNGASKVPKVPRVQVARGPRVLSSPVVVPPSPLVLVCLCRPKRQSLPGLQACNQRTCPISISTCTLDSNSPLSCFPFLLPLGHLINPQPSSLTPENIPTLHSYSYLCSTAPDLVCNSTSIRSCLTMVSSTTSSNGHAPRLQLIDASFNPQDSEASALDLVYRIQSKWRDGPGKIEIVKFTDGITNTVSLAHPQPTNPSCASTCSSSTLVRSCSKSPNTLRA